MGSQIIPKEFCKAKEAAAIDCSKLPPFISTSAAAAIPPPEPVSAIQPPTSAANVACAAINTPIRPADNMAFIIASSLLLIQCAVPNTTPGKPPQEPAVGAATITPMELFTSIIADTYIIVVLSTSPPINSFASYVFLNCGD